MSRLRRAWAVLRGREDPELTRLARTITRQGEDCDDLTKKLAAEVKLVASLRASLDDAHRQHAITSAKAAGLERVLRTILEAADHGLANPTENGR